MFTKDDAVIMTANFADAPPISNFSEWMKVLHCLVFGIICMFSVIQYILSNTITD